MRTVAPVLAVLFLNSYNGADGKVKGELNEVLGQSESILGVFPSGEGGGKKKQLT